MTGWPSPPCPAFSAGCSARRAAATVVGLVMTAAVMAGCTGDGSAGPPAAVSVSGAGGSPSVAASASGADAALVLVVDALDSVARDEPVRVELRAADGKRSITEYVPPEAKHVAYPDLNTETIVLGDRSWSRRGRAPWSAVPALDPGPAELELDPVTAREAGAGESVSAALPALAAGERRFVVTFDDRSSAVLDIDAHDRPVRMERRLADDPAHPELSTYTYDPSITVSPPPTSS